MTIADAHIEGQRRIRSALERAVADAWTNLGTWDEEDVDRWLLTVLPLVAAAQRTGAALTNAFLAAVVGRSPIGLPLDDLTGAAVRNGAPPREVYRRPFVTYWTALKDGADWADAHTAGRARASSTAAMDVQLSMRATLRAVGERDDNILGYRRVPDGDACEFCKLIAGQRYTVSDLMPVHNRCGCGVDVITRENRGDFTGRAENDLDLPARVAIHEHGELGPVVTDANHHFTDAAALAA